MSLKVVMVTLFPDQPDRITGGVAAVAVYLIRELSRVPGLELEVVAFGSMLGERTEQFEQVRIHYLRPPTLPTVVARAWYEQPRDVNRKLAELQYDLVHVQGLAFLTMRCPKPRVLTIHGIAERDTLFHGAGWSRWVRSKAFALVEGNARRFCENVIVISPYVRQALAHQLRGRLWDIANPVAESFFDLPRRTEAGRILFCGVLTPLKNVLGLIEAFGLIAGDMPHAQLRIAGGDLASDYAGQCQALARKLGLAERVHFLGQLSVARVQEELTRAACLALCSFQENAPVSIEEALAAGVPVVGSRLCGIPFMVDDGQTGKLVNPADVTDVAAGLRYVLTAAGPEMSDRAVAQAQRFRASVVARRTYEVYQQVMGGK